MKKLVKLIMLCCSLSAGLFADHAADLAAAYTTLENLKQAKASASEIDAAQKIFDDLMNMVDDDGLKAQKMPASALNVQNLEEHFLGLIAVINYDALSYDDQLIMNAVKSRMRHALKFVNDFDHKIYSLIYIKAAFEAQEEVLLMLELLSVDGATFESDVPLGANEYAHVAVATLSDLVAWLYDVMVDIDFAVSRTELEQVDVCSIVYQNLPLRFRQQLLWSVCAGDGDAWDLLHDVHTMWKFRQQEARVQPLQGKLFTESAEWRAKNQLNSPAPAYDYMRAFVLQPKKTEEVLSGLETKLYRLYKVDCVKKNIFEIFVRRLNVLKKEVMLHANFKSNDSKVDVLIKHKALLEDESYAALLHSSHLREIVGQYRKVVEGVLYENLGSLQLTYELYALTKKLTRLQGQHQGWFGRKSLEEQLANDMLAVLQDAAVMIQKNAKSTVLSGQLFDQAQGLLDHPLIKKTLDRYVGISQADIKKTALNIVGTVSPLVALGILKLVAPQAEQEIKKEAATVTVEGPHIASYLEKHPEVFEKLLAQHPDLVERLAQQVATKLNADA